MQETQVQSLCQEDPLTEKGMAIHYSILTWEIPWPEEPGGLQSMGVTKSWTQLKQLSTHAVSPIKLSFVFSASILLTIPERKE